MPDNPLTLTRQPRRLALRRNSSSTDEFDAVALSAMAVRSSLRRTRRFAPSRLPKGRP